MTPADHRADDAGRVTSRRFGRLPDGRHVTEYTLTNRAGMRARILDYGGIIRTLEIPDRNGQLADVVLGFDELQPYTERHPYFGSLVGRYAGRIAKGRCAVDGVDITLARNEGDHHLHGGINGFDRAVWHATVSDGSAQLILNHVSRAGDEGYPGTLTVTVTYTLSEDALRVAYAATTDATTVLNLTQHSYFNLSGQHERDVLDHELHVRADTILEIDEDSIPSGRLLPVSGTPFDFGTPKRIGRDLADPHRQLGIAKGYDHTYVLKHAGGQPAAVLDDPASGRRLEIRTTEPAVQVYTGNNLDGSIAGKKGCVYNQYAAIALETQHYPDSPNRPDFPTTALRAGETFRSDTEFRFTVIG